MSSKNIIVLIFYLTLSINSIAQNNHCLKAKSFSAQIQQHKNALILDAQISENFAAAHIPNAISVPTEKQLLDIVEIIPKSDTLFVYCRYGQRSKTIVDILKKEGFTHIYELKGGLNKWIKAGLAVDSLSHK